MVQAGVKPEIYYHHTCSQCFAVLEIKSTLPKFKCPCCESEETCLQIPTYMIKKYLPRTESPRETLKRHPSKKSSKLTMSGKFA